MKKEMMKRLVSWVVAAAMVVAMLPVSVLGAPVNGNVAKIGDTEYATLDEAVKAAPDGATIELLGDCTTTGLNLSKNLTIQAAAGLEEKPTVTFDTYGVALWGKSLTFKDCDVLMNKISSTPYTAEWNWMAICASTNASLTLDNVNMTMDATGASGSPHAIYFCNNNVLNVVNGSNLTIKNYPNDALEWDGGNGGYNVNITDSTFVADHNRSGFTGTFVATITNSRVDVINSIGNGSNGSHFDIENSVVNFSGNGSHGLSAGKLSVTDSTIMANDNGMCGVIFTGAGNFVNSNITITGSKGVSYWNAGMRLYTSSATATIDKDTSLTISDNEVTGLFLDSGTQLTIEDGAQVLVTRNHAEQANCTIAKDTAKKGGGIMVRSGASAMIPASAEIYNNHAALAGDDVFVEETGTITFGKVGTDWVLDDCEHLIDGWYLDGEGTRWQVCDLAEGETTYAEEYVLENATATVTGLKALKAAHGLEPKDKVSYPGLDKQVKDDDEDWNDDVDAAAGQEVNFQLTSNVPTDLLNYLNPEDVTPPSIDGEEPGAAEKVEIAGRGSYVLTFHDKLNEKLTNPENYVVKIGETALRTDQYTLVTTELEDGCSFEISLDLVKLYEAGVITKEDIEKATPITVTYDATLSKEAEAGTYENTAWVTAPDWTTSKDIVSVNTYAIDIFKYDQADPEKGLAGAEFELYQKDTEGNVLEDSKQTLTSDANGKILVDGLDAGTYYLKETQAPDGYVCSTAELTIVIPGSADADNTVSVRFANSQIPHTGGSGTLMFTIGGAMLMATAGMLLVVSRKRRKA